MKLEEAIKGYRCHECTYCERHYIDNTTWSECRKDLQTFAEFTYGKKVDGREKACDSFIFSGRNARYEHKKEARQCLT